MDTNKPDNPAKSGLKGWIDLAVILAAPVVALALALVLLGKDLLTGYLALTLFRILISPMAVPAAVVCLLLAIVVVFTRKRVVRWTAAGLLAAISLTATSFLWWPALMAKEKPMTYEDVKDLKFRVIAKGTGVAFDIPVLYNYNWPVEEFGQWAHPDKDEAQGKTRRTVDYVIFTTLYPEMAPYTKENAAEFAARGWGRRVEAQITRPQFPDKRNFQGLFNNRYPRLERLPALPDVTGMIRFRDSRDELYLSHDQPADDLIIMDCGVPTHETIYPSCKVEQVATIAGARFRLEYRFSRDYLPQWQDIDVKVKALFEQFAADAASNK